MRSTEPPAEIQREINGLVSTLQVGHPVTSYPTLDIVEAWLAENADLFDYDDDFFKGVRIGSRQLAFSDDELRAYGSLEGLRITDGDRLAFMEDRISSALEDGDADEVPVFHSVPIRSSFGRQGEMGYGVTGYSFEIVSITWYGLFASRSEFRAWLESEGWITSVETFAARTPADRLRLWKVV